MKILVVQESDWIEKGPHQSHHLMERLSKRGHEVRVIDYEILWREHKKKELISKREVFRNVHKVVDEGGVTVIRPSIIKLPVLDYLSLVYTHRKEIERQIEEFKPDVIVGFGILNANIAIRLAKKRGIPFVYYIIDELHRLVPQKYFQWLAKYVESKNMKNADKVISINEGLREYTIRMGAERETPPAAVTDRKEESSPGGTKAGTKEGAPARAPATTGEEEDASSAAADETEELGTTVSAAPVEENAPAVAGGERTETPPPAARRDAPAEPVAGPAFGVHVESFPTWDDADRASERFIDAGETVTIVEKAIPGKGTWYRIVLGRFAGAGEARAHAEEVKARFDLDYVLVVRIKG